MGAVPFPAGAALAVPLGPGRYRPLGPDPLVLSASALARSPRNCLIPTRTCASIHIDFVGFAPRGPHSLGVIGPLKGGEATPFPMLFVPWR